MSTKISQLDDISKKDIIKKALNHKLKYRTKIGLSKKIKFGIEIEALGNSFMDVLQKHKDVFYYKDNPMRKPRNIYSNNKWILYHESTLFDDSGRGVYPSFSKLRKNNINNIVDWETVMLPFYEGGEITSPILIDDVYCWEDIKNMLKYMKDNIINLRVNDSCSCHTHFDIGIFDNDPLTLYSFIILLAECETVLSRFYSGEFINLRSAVNEWAKPIKSLIRCGIDLDMDISSYKSLIRSIYLGDPIMKEYSFDFWEIYNNYYVNLSSTFENRLPNGTLEETIIQNNVMLMGYLMEYVSKGKYDVEKGKYNLKKMNKIEDPFYVADMLPKDDFKFDFLTQYYKDGKYTKSKELVRSKRIFY